MHIRELPSGRWRVIVQVDGRRLSGTADTRKGAKALGHQLSLDAGRAPKAVDVTLGELLSDRIEAAGWAPTYSEDCRRVVAALPAETAALGIGALTPIVVERIFARLRADGWSPHRLVRLRSIMRPALAAAVRWGWLAANPAADVAIAVPARRPIEPAEPADVAALLVAVDDFSPALGVAIRLSAVTGVRLGELCGLRWADLDEGRLKVRRGVSTTKGAMHVGGGKTEAKGHRRISLDATTLAMLDAHRARMVAAAAANRLDVGEWMFSHDWAQPWRPGYVTKALSRICAREGLAPISHRNLRHFVATRLLAAGVDVRTVAGRLGHARVATTLEVYADFVPAADAAAADIMGQMLDGIG